MYNSLSKMVKSGLVQYGEIVIDRSFEDTWTSILNYHKWVPGHASGSRRILHGVPGEVGELVEVFKDGSAGAMYVETVRIRSPHHVAGLGSCASVVYRAYDEPISYARFSEFRLIGIGGKTVLLRSLYCEVDPDSEAFLNARAAQCQPIEDELPVESMKRDIEAYIDGTIRQADRTEK